MARVEAIADRGPPARQIRIASDPFCRSEFPTNNIVGIQKGSKLMKALVPAGMALFVMVACTAQQPPSPPSPQGTLNQQWLGAGTGPTVVGGSASDTTTAFDGTYKGLSNLSASAAGAGLKAFEPTTTGCQRFDEPPTMTIANGLAQFQALGVTFAGYVTPQGHLRMISGYGPTTEVDFDPRSKIFRGRAISVNCRYDVAWQKTA